MVDRALPLDEDDGPLQLPPNPLFDGPDAGTDGKEGKSNILPVLKSTGYGVVSSVAGGLQYLTGAEEDSGVAAVRRWGEQGSDAAVGEMSDQGRKNYQAALLPKEGPGNDIWDKDVDLWTSLGLKITSGIPSMAASVIPGGLAARLAIGLGASAAAAGTIGTVAASTAAGIQSGGDVFNGIQKEILDMSDAELKDESPAYEAMRNAGHSEEEAKRRVIETAAGMKPMLMAGITALTSKYGVEGLIAKRAKGEIAHGIVKRAATAGVGETTQEFVEEGSGEVLKQAGGADARGDNLDVDWYQALEAGLQGAVAGGPMGAAVGAVTGNKHGSTGDPSLDGALQTDEEEDSPPLIMTGIKPNTNAATDTTTNDRVGEVTSEAGAELAALNDKTKTAAQRVKEKVKKGQSPTQAQAAVIAEDNPTPAAPAATAGADPDLVAALTTETPPAAPDPATGKFTDANGMYDPNDPRNRSAEQDAAANTAPVAEAPLPAEVAPAPVSAPVEDPELGEDPDEPEPLVMPPVPPTTQTAPEMAAAITVPEGGTVAPEAPVSPPVATAEVNETVTPPENVPLIPVEPGQTILRDQTEDDDAAFNEALRAEEEEAARKAAEPKKARTREADAAAAAKTGAVGTLSTDPATFGTANDYKTVWRTGDKLQKEAAKSGVPLDPDWAAILTLRGKLVGKNAAANKPVYLAIRQRIADKAAEAPAVRGVERVKAQKVDAEQASSEKVKNLLTGDYTDEQRAGKPEAIRQYINNLVLKAKAEGVTVIPKGTTDPYLLHLKQAQALRAVKNETKLTDFMATDFGLRSGDTDMVAEYRKAQALKAAPSFVEDGGKKVKGKGTEDGAGPGVFTTGDAGTGLLSKDADMISSTDDSGADASELYDKGSSNDGLTTAEDTEEDLGMTAEEEVYQDAPVRERPKVEVGEDSYTVAAPARVAVVETKKRRTVTPPGKSAAKPAVVSKGAQLKQATSHLATPSEAQAAAENYPKAHVEIAGMPVTIETKKGGERKGTAPDGTKWSVRLRAAYGYVKGTSGADGDQVDVYVGDEPSSKRVFVVDQQNLDGSFDEHKVILGAVSRDDAERIYVNGFSDGSGPDRLQAMTEMTTEQFKEWVKTPAASRPMAPQADKVKTNLRRNLHRKLVAPQTEVQAEEQLAEIRLAENDADVTPGGKRLHVSDDPFFDEQPTSTPGVVRETDVKGLLSDLSMDELSPIQKTLATFIVPRLRRLAGNVKVRVVTTAKMMELYADEMERTGAHHIPDGWYDYEADEIVLREDKMSAPLVVHEVLHAAYSASLENSIPAARAIREMMQDVAERLVAEAVRRGDADVKLPYGLENEHEFISEAFSNAAFQELLARTPLSVRSKASLAGLGKPSTVWGMFISSIKKVLGLSISDSALEGAIRVTNALDTDATALMNPPTFEKRLHTGQSRTVSVREAMADRAEGGSMGLRRFGLAVRTFDQIRQRYAGLFVKDNVDQLDVLVKALQRQEADGQKTREAGHKHAADFLTIREKDPAEAAKAADLMIDATMAGVNLINGAATEADLLAANPHLGKKSKRHFQTKARLPILQERFMALKPATREYILASAKYYRDTQNSLTRETVGNILDTLETPLDPAVRAALINQTVNGTLDETASNQINNEIIFNALKNAAELRVVNGLYFPLMRHGDFVVTAENKMPANLHGGKEVAPGIIEWSGADDAAALAGWEQFAADNSIDVNVTSLGKIYRLANGEQVQKQNINNRPVTHHYRARVQTQTVMFFDTAREANKYIREAKQAGYYKNIVPKPLQRASMETSGDLSSTQMRSITGSIDKRSSLSEGEKNMLKATLAQASIRLMSGNRIQHRSLARRNVYGASHDMARNAVSYSEAAGRYLAKVRHMPAVRAAMKNMEDAIKTDLYSEDRQARGQVLDEVKKRVDKNVTNITKTSPIIQDIMALSYLDKLFSPAYSIVNGMQPWMVTAPILSGEFGVLRTGKEMARAYNSVGGLGVVGSGLANSYRASKAIAKAALDTSDVVGSIRKNLAAEPDGQSLTELLDVLIDRGTIDQSSGLEIAASVASGRGKWGTGLAKVDRIARQLPIAVEAINRSVTAVTAYRLSRAGGLTHAQAMEHAFNTVQNTQGDYSAVNAPAFFNHPLLRPALQFKKYAQMMAHLLVDMTRRAMFAKGRERRVALKQIMGIVAVQMAMAGAMGLPGLELLKIGFMVAAALGLGDGWDEEERYLRGILDQSVGKTWGELISKGVLSRAIPAPGGHGVDMSGRLSLADMMTFGSPKSNDREGMQSYLFALFGGAPASLLLDWADGTAAAANGEWGKAAGLMLPNKFIADTAKAVTKRNEGDITTGEAVLQSIGFRSGRMAEKGDEIGKSVAQSKNREAEAKKLSRAYLAATNKGELTKIKAQIAAHNKAEGVGLKQKVFPKALDNVRKRREVERRNLQGE